MHVVRRPGKPDAEVPDMVLQLFCECAGLGIQFGQVFDGLLCLLFEPRHIDSEELPVLHHNLASNQYSVYCRGIFGVD
jgi:hypothetical protein